MPHVVWIQMSAPEADEGDPALLAQLPSLIEELMAAGWGVAAPGPDDDEEDNGPDEPPELLDVDLTVFPGGLRIGLVVDTDRISEATAIGAGLGEHLVDAAPALLGWTVNALLAEPR